MNGPEAAITRTNGTTTEMDAALIHSELGFSGEDVAQLAEALRAAKRSHIQYLAELRQGDVEPAEDWATWYAEFLVGDRR
jgi:hypothetical protein